MSAYNAPLTDMWFVLREIVGIEQLVELPGFEDLGLETIESMLEEAGKFAGDVLAPLNQSGDVQGATWADGQVRMPEGFRAAYEAFAANGWARLGSAAEFGGLSVPRVVTAAVREMWSGANMAFGLSPALGAGAIEALTLCASTQLKQLFLPRMVSGEWTGSMNLTEPQAGSDLAAIQTRAEPQPDGTYLIKGQKIFITYGEHDLTENIVHLVLARVPGAPEGTKGISMFVVPKFLVNADGSLGERNDLVCTSIEHKLGIHACPTCVMAFGERGGAVGYRVGELNRGLEYMFIMMNDARLVSAIQGIAVAERAYQQASAYALERVQGRDIAGGKSSVRIIEHPDVRRMLMLMRCQIEAMRALAYFVAGAHDQADQHPDPEERGRNAALVGLLTPVLKGWCTETAIEIASIGIQIHGGVGYVEGTGVAQYLRDVRITAIYEGTTGIQANDLIGRKIVHDRGAAVGKLMQEMQALACRLVGTAHEDLPVIGGALQAGIAALRRAVDHVLANFSNQPRRTAVGAVPLLKLFGVVAGGWLMGRAAEAAAHKLASGSKGRSGLEMKLNTARFFADHVLVLAPGMAHSVCDGAGRIMEIDASQW